MGIFNLFRMCYIVIILPCSIEQHMSLCVPVRSALLQRLKQVFQMLLFIEEAMAKLYEYKTIALDEKETQWT